MAKDISAQNPPPAPLLENLGDTPGKRMDIEDLRTFLSLLFEQLGGGDDNFENVLQQAMIRAAALNARLGSVSQRLDALELLLTSRQPSRHTTESLQVPQHMASIGALRQSIAAKYGPGDDVVLGSGSTMPDFGGVARRVAATTGKTELTTSRNLAASDLGNGVFAYGSASLTLTLPSALGSDGVMAKLLTGATTSLTIAEGSGVTLYWRQGGSVATGPRTLAAGSAADIFRYSPTEWFIWGDSGLT